MFSTSEKPELGEKQCFEVRGLLDRIRVSWHLDLCRELTKMNELNMEIPTELAQPADTANARAVLES